MIKKKHRKTPIVPKLNLSSNVEGPQEEESKDPGQELGEEIELAFSNDSNLDNDSVSGHDDASFTRESLPPYS